MHLISQLLIPKQTCVINAINENITSHTSRIAQIGTKWTITIEQTLAKCDDNISALDTRIVRLNPTPLITWVKLTLEAQPYTRITIEIIEEMTERRIIIVIVFFVTDYANKKTNWELTFWIALVILALTSNIQAFRLDTYNTANKRVIKLICRTNLLLSSLWLRSNLNNTNLYETKQNFSIYYQQQTTWMMIDDVALSLNHD